MPAPNNDRAALERERDELPSLITRYERELLVTPIEEMEKRERLRWQSATIEESVDRDQREADAGAKKLEEVEQPSGYR